MGVLLFAPSAISRRYHVGSENANFAGTVGVFGAVTGTVLPGGTVCKVSRCVPTVPFGLKPLWNKALRRDSCFSVSVPRQLSNTLRQAGRDGTPP